MDFAIVTKRGITFGNSKAILHYPDTPFDSSKLDPLFFVPLGMRREKYQTVHLLRWPDRQFGTDRARLVHGKRFGICHSYRSTSIVSG